jgi:hypothetical protein
MADLNIDEKREVIGALIQKTKKSFEDNVDIALGEINKTVSDIVVNIFPDASKNYIEQKDRVIKPITSENPPNFDSMKLANETLFGGVAKDLTSSFINKPINFDGVKPLNLDVNELNKNVKKLDVSDVTYGQLIQRQWGEQDKVTNLKAGVWSQALLGKISDQDAMDITDDAVIKYNQENGVLDNYDLLQNPLKVIVGESARQANLMLDTIYAGAKSGMQAAPVGAGIALAAGQAGPQILTCEEVLTVPAASAAAFSVGMIYGGAKYIFDLEASSMYEDLTRGGVDRKIAQPAAFAVGVVNSFIEMAGMGSILAGNFSAPIVTKAAKNLTHSITRRALTTFAKSYALNNGIEVTEEVLQTLVSDFTKFAAQTLTSSPKKLVDKKSFLQDIKDSVFMTLAGGGVLSGVGATIDTVKFHRALNRNFKEIRKQQETKAQEKANPLQKQQMSAKAQEMQNQMDQELKDEEIQNKHEAYLNEQIKLKEDTKKKIIEAVLTPEEVKLVQEAKEKEIPNIRIDLKENSKFQNFIFRKFSNAVFLWDTLIEILDKNNVFGENNPLAVSDAEQTYKKYVIQGRDLHSKALEEEFKKIGLNDNDVIKKITNDYKESIIGQYINVDGEIRDLKWTPGQARSFYMMAKNADTKEKLRYTGYTFIGDLSDPNLVTTEQLVNRMLTPEDRAIIEANKKYFDQEWEIANEFKLQRTGKPLGYRENYITRQLIQDYDRDLTAQEIEDNKTDLTPSVFKSMSLGKEEVGAVVRNDMDTVRNYNDNIAQWIAWQDKIDLLNSVFGDPTIRKAIGTKFGGFKEKKNEAVGLTNPMLDTIDNHINSFALGEARKYREWADKVIGQKFVSNFSKAQLWGKILQYPLQASAVISLLPYVKEKGMLITGLTSFMSDPMAAIETINKTPDVRYRLSTGITKEVAIMNELRHHFKLGNFDELGLFFTKYGDLGSVTVGGYMVYLDQMQQHQNHEQAIKYTIKAINEVLQSPDLSQLTAAHKSSSAVMAILNNFIQASNQQLNKTIRDFVRLGKTGSKDDLEKAISTALTFAVLVPVARVFISSLGTASKSDLISAMLSSLPDGIILVGNMFNFAITSFLRAEFDEGNMYDLKVMKGLDYFVDIYQNSIIQFSSDIRHNEWSKKSWKGIADLVSGVADIGTGLPITRLNKATQAGLEGNMDKALLMGLLGIAPSVASKLTGETSNKKSKSKKVSSYGTY